MGVFANFCFTHPWNLYHQFKRIVIILELVTIFELVTTFELVRYAETGNNVYMYYFTQASSA